MTSTTNRPTTQTYRVLVEQGSTSTALLQAVDAAYFKQDGDFISFKDADNKVVFFVRAASVLSIERVDVQQDGRSNG